MGAGRWTSPAWTAPQREVGFSIVGSAPRRAPRVGYSDTDLKSLLLRGLRQEDGDYRTNSRWI